MKIKLPDFTMTRGKVPEAGAALRGLRRNLKAFLLWTGLAFLFFVFFAWLSLPTRAIAWRISHEAKIRGFVVDIEDVSISPFGGITLENVAWTYEPSRPGEAPTKWFVEEVDVDVSIIKLMWGTVDVDVELELEEGIAEASFVRAGETTEIHVEIAELPLYAIPKARQALNAPLTGLFGLQVDLTLPENKFAKAEGKIVLECSACKLGDGEEKLFVPGSAALKNGLVIPEVDLGSLRGVMTVEKGVAKTDGPIETDSEDVWLFFEGQIKLRDPFPKSRLDMVLKFNLSDALQAESEPMRFMIQTAHEHTKLKAPEQGLGFKLGGPVTKPRFRGIHSKSRREARADRRARQRAREEKRRKQKEERAKARAKKKEEQKAKQDDNKMEFEPKPDDAEESDSGGDKPLQVEPIGDEGGDEPADRPALPPPEDEPEQPPPEPYPPADDGGEAPPEPGDAVEPGDDGIVIEDPPPGDEPPPQDDPSQPPDGGDQGDPGDQGNDQIIE